MKEVRLNEIADVSSGATLNRFKDEKGSFQKVIVQRSIKKGEKLTDFDNIRLMDKISKKAHFVTKEGDILMKTPSPNDAIYVEEEGLIIGDRIALIRLKDGYDPCFISNLLNNYHVKKQLHKVMSSESIPQASIEEIKELKLKVPDYDKQVEYGKFLEAIDEKIKISYQMIEADSRLKEGFINKLMGAVFNEKR